MKLALNYSPQAAALIQAGRIECDFFKCPPWADMIAEACQTRPVYVHFPFNTGLGLGSAVDKDTKRPPDWPALEQIIQKTRTPFVNVHLELDKESFPDIPEHQILPADYDFLVDQLIRDVSAVVDHLGPKRVIVENNHDKGNWDRSPALFPEVITRVVEETGCGFLLDLSHARLAAAHLGLDPKMYIHRLPVKEIREVHITGIQLFDANKISLVKKAGLKPKKIEKYARRPMDHLPITAEDWRFIEWAIAQIQSGKWRQPWVMTFEYGGTGPFFGTFTDEDVLVQQVPRLYDLVKNHSIPAQHAATSPDRREPLH